MNTKDKHDKSNFGLRNKFKWEFPNIRNPRVQIDSKHSNIFEEFKREGALSIINDKTIRVAKYLYENYVEKYNKYVDDSYEVEEGEDLSKREGGNQFAISLFKPGVHPKALVIPFSDPMLASLLFDENLCALLYNYYKRQAFYTRPPIVRLMDAGESDRSVIDKGAGRWHTHHYHPIVLMLNLHEIRMEDTHLEVAKGTHKISLFTDGRGQGMDFVEEKMEIFPSDMIYHGVGPIGTMHLFDSRAYHRVHMLPGRPRADLHLHITTGNYLNPSHGVSKEAFQKFKENLKGDFNQVDKVMPEISAHALAMLNSLKSNLS